MSQCLEVLQDVILVDFMPTDRLMCNYFHPEQGWPNISRPCLHILDCLCHFWSADLQVAIGFRMHMNHSAFGNCIAQLQPRIWSMMSWWNKSYVPRPAHAYLWSYFCLEVKMKFDCKFSRMVGDTPSKSLKIPFSATRIHHEVMYIFQDFAHTTLIA